MKSCFSCLSLSSLNSSIPVSQINPSNQPSVTGDICFVEHNPFVNVGINPPNQTLIRGQVYFTSKVDLPNLLQIASKNIDNETQPDATRQLINLGQSNLFHFPIPKNSEQKNIQIQEIKSVIPEYRNWDVSPHPSTQQNFSPESRNSSTLPSRSLLEEFNKSLSISSQDDSSQLNITFDQGFIRETLYSDKLNIQKESAVEISQSPSQVDKSIQNESKNPSPAPNPKAKSGGDTAIGYLSV